jgi:hypothetical protein
MPTCPECEVEGVVCELQKEGAWNTDWYGRLTWYRCTTCGEYFVQRNDDEVEISAE